MRRRNCVWWGVGQAEWGAWSVVGSVWHVGIYITDDNYTRRMMELL